MELSFGSEKLRDLCERQQVAEAKFGASLTRELRCLLAEMEAAESVGDILELCADHFIECGDRMTVTRSTIRVELCSGHVKPRLGPDGKVDWRRVTRLRLESIEATND